MKLRDGEIPRRCLLLSSRPVGMRWVEYEGGDYAGCSSDEWQDGEGHVGVIDVPCPVAGVVNSTARQDAVAAADEDEGDADTGRYDVEGHVC